MSKVLLCGDRSFVARGLVERLERDGHQVITFSRGPEKREGNRVTGNVDRMSGHPHLNEPFDVVLNYILLKDDPIETNDRYLQSVLDFCKARGVKHLVHISSVSVYSGDVTRVVEEAQVETVPENKGSYGSRKVAQDLYLNKNAPADLRISYVRPGFVLAPGLMDPTIGMGLRMGHNNLLLIGSTKNQLPVVTRDQVHEAVARVVNSEEKTKREAFLVLDTNSPTRQEWLTACCTLLGCGAKVVSFPTPLWRLAGFGGGMLAKLAGMAMKPGLIIKNACRRQEFDSSGTQKRLGMKMDVDWRKELVSSFNDQERPAMPYATIPWRKVDNVKRITILGYGQVVMQKHKPALKRLGFNGEIVAFDIAAGTAKDGQPVKALDAEPLPPSDLLVLASPGPVHVKAIPTLEKLDAPLLIEKPLCYSAAELEQWSQFARSRKSPAVVCQNFRFKSNVERMMQHLARYAPGKLLHVDISFQSPSIGKEWRTWTRDERRARTLLMDYSVHYLDVACMFATDGWKLAHSRYELDHMGFTSLIEGRFDSPHYPVNFVLRQGLMPRRARLRFTFQNYLVSLGFFPDTFVAYMADDGAGLYAAEKKEAARATRAKIIDKLTGRDSDTSHAAAYLAALGKDDFAKPLSIDSLRSYYNAVFELADAVYGAWK